MAKLKLRKPTIRDIPKILLYMFLAIMIVIASAGVYMGISIYQDTDGFSVDKLTTTEASVYYDADGNEFYITGSDGTVNTNVEYDDLPQVLIDAVVAAEDSRYFVHNGFDLPRIVKAFMGNIIAGRITSGGSTITQQLIKKSYYPNEEQTIERKVGEIILSVQASKELTKEKVLELYLNKIYYGNSSKAVGIYAASYYYFGKDCKNLTLVEAALLAGTINAPSAYDPFYDLEKAQSRRDTILDLMCTHGYITEEERDAAQAIPVENTLNYDPITTSGEYQAYADMVTREIYEMTGYDPTTTSMKVYTYMDSGLQELLDGIADGSEFTFINDVEQVGACVQDTQGRVIGVLSARDYTAMGTTYAYAADKERVANGEISAYGQRNQPGSSLKPIVAYASAFEYLNYSTAHYVHDTPYSSGDWTPKNWDSSYHGDLSIKEALYQSWNLAAINTLNEVISEVGTDTMTEYMEGFGFDMYDEDFGLSYAIGGWSTGVSPEESAGAYAAIANGGTYYEPHTVEKIEIVSTGEVIYIDEQVQEEATRAISEESAFMIREIMTEYVSESLGQYGVFNLGYQIGAKSGTSNYPTSGDIPNTSLYGKSKDSWMVGFSPDYSWAVWCGYDSDAQKEGYYMSGHDARSIAVLIAKYLHQDGVENSYSTPSGVEEDTIVSGIYPYVSPGSGIPSSRKVTGWFKTGYGPTSSLSATAVSDLDEFTATVSSNKITVEFSEYPSATTPTKTYKLNGKSYTLTYLGDKDDLVADADYVVEVSDSSGNVVYTETLTSNRGTLNYTLSGGDYTVTAVETATDGTTKDLGSLSVTTSGATEEATE